MLGRSPSASTPSKCSTISSEPVHVFNTLSSLPHKISSSNSASSPPLARSFSQSVTKFTPNEQHSQKPKLRDGLQTWTSNVFKKLRHSLRALIRSHDNYKEEDYIYDIEIERTVRDGSVTVAKALFDSGCGCEGILISESLAESAGIPDPKFPNILEPTEYGFLNGLGCHGYSHDMCQMRWSAKQYEERKNQAIFLSPAFMKSKVTIIPNLQVDVVIGLPEIKRLGLDRKKKFLFGLFPKMATPDTSTWTLVSLT